MSNISRPTKVSFKEFKNKLVDCDGFRQARRIILYDQVDPNHFGYRYRIPIVGRKLDAYKEAYRLFFEEEDEAMRSHFIQEGNFKSPLSWDFTNARYV